MSYGREGFEDVETDCEICGSHVSDRCPKCRRVFDGVWDVEERDSHDPETCADGE